MTSSCPLRKVPDGEFRRSDFCYVLLGEPSDAFESGLQLPLKLCHLRMPLCIVFYVAICVAWRCAGIGGNLDLGAEAHQGF